MPCGFVLQLNLKLEADCMLRDLHNKADIERALGVVGILKGKTLEEYTRDLLEDIVGKPAAFFNVDAELKKNIGFALGIKTFGWLNEDHIKLLGQRGNVAPH